MNYAIESVLFVSKDARTFGGDNYRFSNTVHHYIVSVSWGLFSPNMTAVFRNGKEIAVWREDRRILPVEAFSRLGIHVLAFGGS